MNNNDQILVIGRNQEHALLHLKQTNTIYYFQLFKRLPFTRSRIKPLTRSSVFSLIKQDKIAERSYKQASFTWKFFVLILANVLDIHTHGQ